MSMICVICQDALLGVQGEGQGHRPPSTMTNYNLGPLPLTDNNNIVTATCGHMIHQTCLQDWYRAEDTRHCAAGTLCWKKTCPYCQKELDHVGFFRIYPIFDEVTTVGQTMESQSSAALKEKCEDLGKLVCFLENEVEKLKQERIIEKYNSGKSEPSLVNMPLGSKKKTRNVRQSKSKMAADKGQESSSAHSMTQAWATSNQYSYRNSGSALAHTVTSASASATTGSEIDNQPVGYPIWGVGTAGVEVKMPEAQSSSSSSMSTVPRYPSTLNSTPYRPYYQAPPPLGQSASLLERSITRIPGFNQPGPFTTRLRSNPQPPTPRASSATAQLAQLSQEYKGGTAGFRSAPDYGHPIQGPSNGGHAQQRPPPAHIQNHSAGHPQYPSHFYNVAAQQYPDPRGSIIGHGPAPVSGPASRDPIITSSLNTTTSQYSAQQQQQPSTSSSTSSCGIVLNATPLGENVQAGTPSERCQMKAWRDFYPTILQQQQQQQQLSTFDFDSIAEFALDSTANSEQRN